MFVAEGFAVVARGSLALQLVTSSGTSLAWQPLRLSDLVLGHFSNDKTEDLAHVYENCELVPQINIALGGQSMSRNFIIEEKGFPELPKLMLATLDALRAIGGSATLHELDEQVVEKEGVTEEEQSIMMPDGKYRRLNYYLSWARTFLKRGDALENSSRGVWALTDKGEAIRSLDEVKAIFDPCLSG